jgi:hypothetical protein
LEKPSTVTMDANVCIVHALSLGKINDKPIHDLFCKSVRGFVNGCCGESIPIGTFPGEKNDSYKNITKAVNELARKMGGSRRYYENSNILRIGRANLDRLFERIRLFEGHFTEEQIKDILGFYTSNSKDIGTYMNPNKSSIPESHDIELFACAHNLDPEIVHILSDDAHFVGYKKEIDSSKYGLRVLPMRDLNRLLVEYDWPIPN